MFDFFRKHTRLLQGILLPLIFVAFVFVGIEGYTRFSEGGNATVATVAGQPITRVEWDNAHRQQVERLRRQMPDVEASFFDSDEMRQRTLDQLIRDRVALTAVNKLHLVVTDDHVDRVFKTDPQFEMLRRADGSLNRDVIQAQGLSSAMFLERLRQDLASQQVLGGVAGSVFATPATAAAALDAMFQQRELQVQRFDAKDYAAQVKPSDAELEAYYKDPANAAQFQAPEQAGIEYVVLDLETLKKGIKIPEEDLRSNYEQNAARYTTPQERRASHILVAVQESASADERAKAKAEAESLLAQVRQQPDRFAELARKHSDDPGSAEHGGDLDFVGRGATTKPFEDALFALKPGEISGVVESEFGYHIIKLTGVRGGEKQSFEAVRAQLENQVRTELAQKKFSEQALDFSNVVYEQPDSLKPAADKFGLELRTAQNVQRTPAPGAQGPLADAKFLEALFSADALRNKRNTDAIETGPNQLVSGRVVQYQPQRLLPFAEVKDRVRARVVAKQAAALAKKAGEARLAEVKAAPGTALAAPAVTASRAQPKDLPRPVLDAALQADAGKLPAVVGVDLGEQGYAVVRVTQVLGRDPMVGDMARAKAEYAQVWGDAETQAYYDALKRRFDVEKTDAASAPAEPVR
jgi:peptidyl-prolyl cis-trans isomerase D